MSPDLDLAIIGGGPAGIATALFFGAAAPHRRARVAVFEKERYPREKICAGAIGARADRVLDTLGVRVDVPSVPVHGMSALTSFGPIHVHRDDRAIGRVVRRVEFDRAFADEARARGVRVVEGARVTSLTFEPDGVRIRTADGEIRARAVVGADGVGSVVRRAIGAPRGLWMAQAVEADTPEVAGALARDRLSFDLTDRSLLGYAWSFPTLVAGAPLVCRGMYELHPDPGALDGAPVPTPLPDLGARLRARLEHLGLAPAQLRRFSQRGLALHEPLARSRALLVGEAAGIDPVLGEGIAQAILYGAAAGPYLARALDRGDLSFHDWPLALRRSRVGLDLRIRTGVTPWFYGRTRPLAERVLSGANDLAIAGMYYFAGERVPRLRLARAGLGLCAGAAHAGMDAAVGRLRGAWGALGTPD